MSGERVAGRRNQLAAALALAAVLGAGSNARAQPEAVPVMVRSAPGRFEVSARDSASAHAVVGLAEETWRLLAAPLNLPPAFSSPIFVRLTTGPEGRTAADDGFGSNVEAGGVVSIWIRTGANDGVPVERILRHALVRGLLLRLAVAGHGGREGIAAPAWLERGAVGWCETRANPAALDALKYEAEFQAPPALGAMLSGGAGGAARLDLGAAVWLFTFLQSESTRAGEWPALLRQVLGGAPADAALRETFPGRFATPEERELWWQTGWHHLRRTRTLPSLAAAESRQELAALARFVFTPGDADVVVPLRTVLEHSADATVAAELKRRGGELARLTVALHPFYRNAGLSLGEAFQAASTAPQREAACAQFDRDWQDAMELEAASKAALDELESRPR